MMNIIFRPAAFSFTFPITLSMAMFGTLCAASTTDEPIAPRLANTAVAAHLEGVHVNQDIANKLLQCSIGLLDEAFIRASLRIGADPEILHKSSARLQHWLCLCLDEEYYPKTGKACTYSEEDWAVLFDADMDRYVSAPDAKKIMQHLMEQGVDINKPSTKGFALAQALRSYQPRAIRVVLDAGANPELLTDAERAKMEEILEKRENYKPAAPQPPRPPQAGEEAEYAGFYLSYALKLMDDSLLNKAMQLVRAEPTAQKILNEALHLQALMFAEEPAPMLYLIEQGADINSASENMIYGVGRVFNQVRTPLSFAASRATPNAEIVKTLIDKGARFLDKEDWEMNPTPSVAGINALQMGESPLMIHLGGDLGAATGYYGLSEATSVYLSLGADPNLRGREGKTALFYACKDSRIKNLQALIKGGAQVNLKDGGGRTPLFIAVEQGSLISTLALLEAGADPFVVDDFGMSILDCQADKRVSGRREREQNTAQAIELVKAYQRALAPLNK